MRVGLEDNIYYSKDVLAESNAQLVERVVGLTKRLEEKLRLLTKPEEF